MRGKISSSNKGFTIVELLIVIVVISVLASIVVVTFNGIQGRARDTERMTDLRAIAMSLEVFYVDNGYYPGYDDFTDGTWRSTNIPNVPADAYVAKPSTASTWTNGEPTDAGTYGYEGVTCTGTTTVTCKKFILHYFSEESSSVKSFNSAN